VLLILIVTINKPYIYKDIEMVISSLKPLPLVSFEPSLSERAIAVAIELFSELNRGDRSSVIKAKEICKIFRLVLLPKESTMQVVNAKLYNWCLQISCNRINQAEIEAVLPELERVWHDSFRSTRALSSRCI
jgi:hypothetical protein